MKGFRRRLRAWVLVLAGASGLIGLSGCQGTEAEDVTYLRFQNPELTAGLDSLHVMGVNVSKGDTIHIHMWRKGEDFPAEVAYPPGLEAAFTLLVQGWKGESLAYQSRSEVAAGRAQAPVRDFRLEAPILTDLPVERTGRVKDAVTLRPAWEGRPGVYRQTDSGGAESFTWEADFTWTRDGQVLGRDSLLAFGALAFADAGTYVFTAENRAGRDSLSFLLSVRHMLPKIGEIKAQAVLAGRALTVRPAVTRSDSLHFRWLKAGRVTSTDSVLAFAALAAKDTGSYQLMVLNASDTAETAVSNHFTVGFAPDPDAVWKAEKSLTAGAQANTSYGTAVDFDASTPRAMLHSEAAQKEATVDLLFVYSGGSLKLMSAPAAKRAGDLNYADDFDDAKIVDVKFVKVTAKPATPAAGRAAYDAGTKVSSLTVAAGHQFLVKTTDGNLAWVKIEKSRAEPGFRRPRTW